MGVPEITVETYHQIWVNYVFGLCAIVVTFYDWADTLPYEISHIWFGRRNAATYLYIATRYVGLVTYGVSAYPLLAGGISLPMCTALRDFHLYASLVIQALTAAVFVLRIYALYINRKLVIGLVSFCVAVFVLAVFIIALGKHEEIVYARALPGCNPLETHAESTHFAVVWSCVSAFDLVVVALTARKGWTAYYHSLSRLWYVFMRDGFVYFTVIFVANTGNILTFVLAPPVLKGVTGVLTTALEATLVSRLILNLRVYDFERRSELEQAATADGTELRVVVHTTTATHSDSHTHGKRQHDSTHTTDDGHSTFLGMEIEEVESDWERRHPGRSGKVRGSPGVYV
ncbi:hypothetical protein PENSPDRAFT_750689 [Peniophora sp. CONT]|nr:hypothetical protein PENSPDRAFT_750689 [Peniophora sp. CONT]